MISHKTNICFVLIISIIHITAMQRNLVLLLKVKSEDDKYETALKARGFTALQVNTLEFEFSHLDKLRDCLNRPKDFSGIILSSPRCVQAIQLALVNVSMDKVWLQNDNYVVGETTYELALKELGLNCMGKESGNANNLADIINGKPKYAKPFLYPHGNLKMDILKDRLENSAELHELLVYDSIPNPNIGKELKEVLDDYKSLPEFIVFFSPSGIKSSIEYLQQLPLHRIKLIAIGPTTEQAMTEQNIDAFSTAHRPTPEDLIAAMT